MEGLVVANLDAIPIVWSQWLVTYVQTERTLTERLFSWPWRPWEKFKIGMEPKAVLYRHPNGLPRLLVAHPSMYYQLLALDIEGIDGAFRTEIHGARLL